MTQTAAAQSFTRDRFTWLAYFLLAYFAVMQAALGPLMPFLRAELNLNYTTAALHVSAFALGMIAAGSSGELIAKRIGRGRLFWIGGGGMAVGAMGLILARTPLLTIPAVLIMGTFGTYLLVTINGTLSEHHGVNRAIALTEANVSAAFFVTAAPFLVSASEGIGLGWRAAILLVCAIWLGFFLTNRQLRFPEPSAAATSKTASTARPLPLQFWLFWFMILFGVAVEWSIGFWGADFLNTSVGFDRVTASGLMTAFYFAMVLGRVVGSGLTHRFAPSRLLLVTVALVIAGFPVFWMGQSPFVSVVGLFVTGLGIANMYPLTLSLATGIDRQQTNKAASRIAVAAGLAILIAPQVLGAIADQYTISGAFGLLVVIIAVVLVLTLLANRKTTAPAQ